MALIIVGAGGLGREVLHWARDAGMPVRGFTDSGAGEPRDALAPVLGDVATVDFDPDDDRFVIAVGNAEARWRLARIVASRGGQLTSVIHPTAFVAGNAVVGEGALICPFAMVGVWSTVGANVVVNTYASVAHDAVVGDHCVFSPYATINGGVRLGEGVFLGTGAIVIPGVEIGPWSRIGAGAVVPRSLPAGSFAVGQPPRREVRYSSPQD